MVFRRGSVACISSAGGASRRSPRFSVADFRANQPSTGTISSSSDHQSHGSHLNSKLTNVCEDETRMFYKEAKFNLQQNLIEKELANNDNSTWLRYVQVYLVNAIKLCQYNPAGDENDGFGPSIKRSKLPLWSRLADLFWLYFTVKMLILEILQHRYSTIMYEIKTLDNGAQQQRQLFALNYTSERRREIQLKLDQVIARISFVGNPFYEIGFALEAVFVLLLFLIYTNKVQNPIHAALQAKPFRVGLVQMLLDPQRERTQTTGRHIEQLVGIFMTSSNNYWRAQRERIWRMYEKLGSRRPHGHRGQMARTGSGRRERLDSICQIDLAEDRTARLMSEMLASGELVPPNRRPPWLEQMAQIYLGLVVFFTCLGLTIIFVVFVFLPTLGWPTIRLHTSARDLLMLVELICYCLVGLQWTNFYLVLVISLALDQMKFVATLRRSIASLIGDICSNHQSRVAVAFAFDSESHEGGEEAMATCRVQNLDRSLIRALIHYKLFKLQLHAIQPVVGFVGGHVIFLMLLLPVMGRLYAAHLSAQVKWIHLVCSLFFIICSDFLVLPNCMLHARCLDLFRDLSSLLAHMDATAHNYQFVVTSESGTVPTDALHPTDGTKEQKMRKQTQQQVIAAHANRLAVWLLRRELHLPDLVLRRFATRAFSLKLTYASWMGVHFWCGLLLAPLLMHDTARPETLGNLFAEILGLF